MAGLVLSPLRLGGLLILGIGRTSSVSPPSPAPAPAPNRPVISIRPQFVGRTGNSIDTVAICNLALSSIGTRSSISSLSEGSAESNALSLHYQPALDFMLRAADWNFARKQVALALLKVNSAATPVQSPWQYQYAYPSDCIKLRSIVPAYTSQIVSGFGPTDTGFTGRTIRFVVGADQDQTDNDIVVVLTNQPQAVASYTRRVTNPALFDAGFVEAFYNYLGSRVCIALNGDKNMAKMAMQVTSQRVAEAEAENGNEGITVIDHMPDWIRVRGVESDFFQEDDFATGPVSTALATPTRPPSPSPAPAPPPPAPAPSPTPGLLAVDGFALAVDGLPLAIT